MKLLNIFFISMTLFGLVSLPIRSEEEKKSSIRFSGIPALGFNADSGFGFGVVGNMYVDEPGFEPYRTSLGAKVYLTTKGMHAHELKIDHLEAFGLPWRVFGRIGFNSTISQNYCGSGSSVSCSPDRPPIEADNLNLTDSDRDNFIKRYYQHRYMSFFGDTLVRWPLLKKEYGFDLTGSYRGRYYLNGDFKTRGAYQNSLFDKDFKDKKTEGYLSTLELGLMLDKRDNEAAPTNGYWLETTGRGGSAFLGSAWEYIGGNLSARFYFPLDSEHKLVIASQSIVDAIGGELPYDAMSRVGGSGAFSDHSAIGGQYIGRGISEQMFVGRFKTIEQLEFRYMFWSFNLWKQNFDITAAALGDFALTSWDYDKFASQMKILHVGFGGGLRIIWNKTFVVRADLAVSPDENFSPKIYLVVGNVF